MLGPFSHLTFKFKVHFKVSFSLFSEQKCEKVSFKFTSEMRKRALMWYSFKEKFFFSFQKTCGKPDPLTLWAQYNFWLFLFELHAILRHWRNVNLNLKGHSTRLCGSNRLMDRLFMPLLCFALEFAYHT